MKKAIVSFKDFSFRYKNQESFTLKNINLDIYEGEKILILGASGSGKSTLGNCINGIIPNQYKGEIKGSCHIKGNDLTKSDIFTLSKVVGTVLQDSDAQFVGLSVAEDIAFSLENINVTVFKMKEMVKKAAKRVEIDKSLDKQPYFLSGGEKQRVAVAGILHEDIDILLLDEPLAALDPKMGLNMIDLIDSLSMEGKTAIIIEHRLEDVLHKKIDRVVLMSDGEIVCIKTPDELIAEGLLKEYGIREPLYISAIRNFFGNLKQSENLTNIEKIDFSKYPNLLLEDIDEKEKKEEEILISLKNVKFEHSDDFSMYISNLEIRSGERIAILGENGSGKSSLSKLLVGLLKEKSGEIIRKNNPKSIKEISELISLVLQNPNRMLVADTVYEEIALALKLRKYSDTEIEKRVSEVLGIIGLKGKRNWPISMLSYGQKKRLSVGIMLALNPKCLILDEPTAGQDYRHYREMMEFVQRINEEKNITIIFITHDMHLALEYTDRAIVLENGKIIADDATYNILNDENIVKRASLKKTSIFDFANKFNVPSHKVIKNFIKKEREKINE